MKELTISNIGERPMAISLVTITDDPGAEFELVQDSCTDRLVEPQQSCVAEVVFSPGEMGERGAALEVHAEMPDSPARLELAGVGIAPLVALSPSTLSFGSQDVATTSGAKTITVRNSGTAPLEIEGLGLEGGGAKDFPSPARQMLESDAAARVRLYGSVCVRPAGGGSAIGRAENQQRCAPSSTGFAYLG